MTDVKVEQCDINEAEEFRDVLDSADVEYPSYVINALAEILARHRQAAEKAQQERDAGIADDYAAKAWGMTEEGHAAERIATAIRSQDHE